MSMGLGEKVIWSADGKSLRIIDDGAAGKLGRPYLSASTAKAMHDNQCAAKWVGQQLLPRVSDPFAANSLGTAGHEVLEVMFNLPPDQRTPERAGKILDEIVAREWPNDAEKGAQWRALVVDGMGKYFAAEDPTKVDLFQTEWRLDGIEVAGVAFKGFIDRLDRVTVNGVEGLKVVDYKTSNKIPDPKYFARSGDEHGDQIRLYRLAVEASKHTQLPILGGQLIYTRHGKIRDVPLTKAAMEATEKGWLHSWSRYLRLAGERNYPVVTGPLCGWCPIVNSCPLAFKEGREAKIEVPTSDELGLSRDDRLEGGQQPVKQAPRTDTPPPIIGEPDASHVHHDSGSKQTTGKKEPSMTYKEAKPYEREGKGYDPERPRPVDWNSYGAMGAVGNSSLAVEIMSRDGVTIDGNGAVVAGLAFTFARVIQKVQVSVTEEDTELPLNWELGLNTRLRGALRTVLECKDMPLPWGDGSTKEQWDEWVLKAAKRVSAIMMVSRKAYTEALPDEPWEALVGVASTAAEPVEEKPTKPATRRTRKPAEAKPEPTEEPTEAQPEEAAEEAAEAKPEPAPLKPPTSRTRRSAEPSAPEPAPEPEPAEKAQPVKAAFDPSEPPPVDFDDDYYE